MRLALAQLRRTWFLFILITLGMLAAVIIACVIPLLSDVMMTAGLRSTLQATPDSAEIIVNTQTDGLSTPVIQNVHKQLDPLFRQNLGSAIEQQQSVIECTDFSFFPAPVQHSLLTVYGTSMQQAAPAMHILQGRLAAITGNGSSEIEVMLTPDTAQQLKVGVGSTFRLALSYTINITEAGGTPVQQQHTALVSAHVAGIFTVPPAAAAYWHGEDFKTLKFAQEGTPTLYQYTILTPDNALLALFDHLRALYHADAIGTNPSDLTSTFSLIWYYRLDTEQVNIHDLDTLIRQLDTIQSTTDSLYGNLEQGVQVGGNDSSATLPYTVGLNLSGPLLSSAGNSILDQFRSRVAVARIPTDVFIILILALILFFVSLITTLLIDHQSNTIAILRSRGASRTQVFGALLLPGIGVGLIALLIGIPAAIGCVLFLSQRMLPAAELDALNIITNNPWQAMLGTVEYAVAIVLVVLLTMSVSLFFAARLNVLSLRQEAARSNKAPMWQRLNLDVIAGVIALVGYGYSLYVTSFGTLLQSDAQVLIATPLAIVSPIFLIIGCLLLFLRIFPLLLRLGARLAARGRGAISLLAFTQLARSPRQSLRMTMLLALATAFALFTLVFSATETQRIQEVVNYQAAADFSGTVYYPKTPVEQVISTYQAIPGVLSASVGFDAQGYGGTANLAMDIRAVDAASFGSAVIWPSQAAYLAARPLLAQLVTLRQPSSVSNVVPAIVDETTISKLLLHVGSLFTINVSDVSPSTLQCVIVGVVEHIPTINHLITSTASGSVLVDYTTYLQAYMQEAKKANTQPALSTSPTISQLWLHTKGDAASLASVRTALEQPIYSITNLVDRRLLLATQQADPLYLVLTSMLNLGTVTALLLALVGTLFASWLSVRSRLLNFVMLRALGGTSRQAVGIFAWEQAIVYGTGILLGGIFGVMLIKTVIPELTFTDLNSTLNTSQFFALQTALATQIVMPSSLALLLVIGGAIFGIALMMMTRIVARPVVGQALRLDVD